MGVNMSWLIILGLSGFVVFACFLVLARRNRLGLGALAFGPVVEVLVWQGRAYQTAETDVDLMVTGLSMMLALGVAILALSGWFIGRWLRARAGA